jgi:hypothetical protein
MLIRLKKVRNGVTGVKMPGSYIEGEVAAAVEYK